MAIQTINLGTAPSGAGGDTFRSTGTKVNENFTNSTHAASRYVGVAAGNLMEVGAFGVGLTQDTRYVSPSEDISNLPNGMYCIENGGHSGILIRQSTSSGRNLLGILGFPSDPNTSAPFYYKINLANGKTLQSQQAYKYIFHTTQNTITDSNGFIKAASPVAQLYADKIAANEEASEQNPIFEKVNTGHYLLKNTEGFSDDGWYIEMPKDANGNVLVAVQYEQLEDNTIEVKTFAKKFDEETGDIVPNLEKPRDIPTGRWIDIRLKALPQPEIEISKTPADFQPTNLAQAVAEALKDDSEQ